jgi:outer membrane protein insertion porin family
MLPSPPFSHRLLALCILAFTAGPVHAQIAIEEEDRPRIEELTFRGVQRVDEDDLRESLFTEATTCKSIVFQPFCWVTDSGTFVEKHYLDRIELERDELRTRIFYYQRGYRDAQVVSEVLPTGAGVAVTFTIQEGTPTRVRSVAVRQTDPVLDERQIAATRLPTEGEPVNLIELDSVKVRLLEELQNRGYADAQARDSIGVFPDEADALVEITIDPGRKTTIKDFVIRGNDKVSERTIRRSIDLQPNDLYQRDELLRSQRRLHESNLFRQTLLTVEDSPDSAKTVVVSVREAPLRAFRTGFGFNTVDFVQTEVGFTRYNWLGGARRLDLHAAIGNLLAPQLNGVAFFYDHDLSPIGLSGEDGNPYLDPTWQLGADLTQPWFLSPKNSLGTGIFAHRRSVPSIVIDRGYGASASFTRRIADGVPLSAEYRFEFSAVEAGDVYFCVNFGVCDSPTTASLRESHRLSPLRLGLLVDRGTDPLFPTSGYNARLDFEHASRFTASDFRYNRLWGEISRYISLGPGVLAGRVRAGWIRPLDSTDDALNRADSRDVSRDGGGIVHPRKRFYAGGSRSVRGYSENQLGPRVLTIAPEKLEDAGGVEACVAGGIGTCDLAVIPSDDFQPRPVGGTTVLEASLEYRFPIWEEIGGAVFIDGATVGAEGGELPATDRKSSVTPGFGIRYASPVGPIRVDLGIRPTLSEELPVITEIIADDGTRRIVELGQTKIYDPLDDSGGWFGQVLERLTLHLSIGEAF